MTQNWGLGRRYLVDKSAYLAHMKPLVESSATHKPDTARST